MKIYYIYTMKMNRHHLLEIILWPNTDGTYRTILNSRQRLKELGIYDDFKLCIRISAREHSSMHRLAEISVGRKPTPPSAKGKHWSLSAETKQKMSVAQTGKPGTNTGKTFSAQWRRRISEGQKGKLRGHWYTDGVHSLQAFECPPGFKPGRIYKRKESSF